MKRVKFYSVTDWDCGYQLQNAEKVIEIFNEKNEYEIEDILEFYNITKYIDNDVFLKKWDNTYINNVKKICKEMKKKIYKYFDEKVSNDSIKNIIKTIPIQYIEDFLELFEKKIENGVKIDFGHESVEMI